MTRLRHLVGRWVGPASIAMVMLGGCATSDPYHAEPVRAHLVRDDEVGHCARLFQGLDARVDAAGVRDAQALRIAGFPYLRIDRFTESLVGESIKQGTAGYFALTGLMVQLDEQARRAELANLGSQRAAAVSDSVETNRALKSCRDALLATDLSASAMLHTVATVPDDYSTLARALGLYPLTRLPFAAGVSRWQEQTRQAFSAMAPLRGDIRRYSPGRLIALPERPRAALFGLPEPTPEQLAAWIERHAPELAIEDVDENDRPGWLHWPNETLSGAPSVDPSRPSAYVRVAATRIGGLPHLQLVYTFWFAARPASHWLDPLAGTLDGLVWRVTLDAAGEPLVYDSIHPCGCYHQFFPTNRMRARAAPQDLDPLDEWMFAPRSQALSPPRAGDRVVLGVTSHSHDLRTVEIKSVATSTNLRYELHDEDILRMLPLSAGASSGTRSIFGPDGLIPGTQRLERWLFWPMGVASAGQMRQWGRHATAFVGRRHFDDPFLFDRYFERLD